MATPVFRSDASMASTRMSMGEDAENEKHATDSTKTHAHKPKPPFFCEGRDGCDRNRDLKHRHAARKDLVLMKIGFRFLLFLLRFVLDLRLFFLVALSFKAV